MNTTAFHLRLILGFFVASSLGAQAYDRYEKLAPFGSKVKDSVLRLSDADQDTLQNYFNRIYARIRLPTDPIEPPTIYLSRKKDAAAFVSPELSKNVVFFNPDFLLKAPHTDFIAFVFAHELTHFDERQEKRRGTSSGNFLNELDADLRGAAERIVRWALTQADGTPEDAVYNLEAIAKELRKRNLFTSSHPNGANVATVLAALFVKERYKRNFPKTTTPASEIHRLQWAIKAAAKKVEALKANKVNDTVRNEVKKEMKRVTKHPLNNALKSLRTLEKKWDSMNKKQRYVEAEEIFFSINSVLLWGSDEEFKLLQKGLYYYGKRLPPDFFTRVQSVLARVNEDTRGLGLEILNHSKFQTFVDVEKFFANLRQDNPSFSQSRFPREVRESKSSLIQGMIARNMRVLRKKSKTLPELTIIPLEFLRLQGKHLHLGSLWWAIPYFRSRNSMDPERVERLLKEGGAPLSLWVALDHNEVEHQLSRDVRRAVILSNFTGISTPIREQISSLTKHDNELSKELFEHFLSKPGLAPGLEFVLNGNALTQSEKDALTARLLQTHVQRMRAEAQKSNALFDPLIEEAHKSESLHATALRYIRSPGRETIDPLDTFVHMPTKILGFHPRSDYARDWSKDRLDKDLWRRSRNFFDNELPLFEEVNELFKKDEEGNFLYPKARSIALQMVSERPVAFLTSTNIPWLEVIPKLKPKAFLSIFLADRSGIRHGETYADFAAAAQAQFTKFLEQKVFPHDVEFAAFSLLSRMVKGGSQQSRKLLSLIEERIRQQDTHDATFRYLGTIAPAMFHRPQDYVEYAGRMLEREIEREKNDLFHPDRRQTSLEKFVARTKEKMSEIDPFLLQKLLDRVAEKTKASLKEKPLFKVDADIDQQAGKAAEYANALLESYESLSVSLRWRFLQFLRGKSGSLFRDHGEPSLGRKTRELLQEINPLTLLRRNFSNKFKTLKQQRALEKTFESEFRRRLQLALQRNDIHVPLDNIEDYLRFHFRGLSPLARGVFFQVALEGNKGLFNERGFKKKIISDLIDNMPKEIRPVVRKIYRSAVRALPDSYENLILAIAYSESGETGSPEVALRLIFQNMGPLVQKFGQALAFDPRLPESYRNELKKLWDEGERPDWWKTQELLTKQYGDFAEAGFRMVDIRNAGTTEIVVELEGPDGRRHITSVQREGLVRQAQVDHEDLSGFVREMSSGWGNKRKWSWMNVLVRDAHKTMELELDRNHKREMTEKMRTAYSAAIARLGGRPANGVSARLQNMTIDTVEYEDHSLPDGKTLVTQSVASGMPLKDLETLDPELYREISQWMVTLENEVQNDLKSPIDKDRMPGQVFVDISDPQQIKVTLLDFGQAKEIDTKVLEIRDAFIGSALAGNGKNIAAILENFGVRLTRKQISSLSKSLARMDAPYRPLQAMEWLHQHKIHKKLGDHYDDLTHVIRAKVRLARWEDSVGIGVVRQEWTDLGRQHHKWGRFLASPIGVCDTQTNQLAN